MPDTAPLAALAPSDLARHAGIELADARKIVSVYHRTGSLPLVTPAGVRRVALDRARASTTTPALAIDARARSSLDPFVKYAFSAPDGARFEAVRIPLERAGRYSVCVSSQVGCALACTFCATGRLGLTRNLAPWEIVEQVRAVRSELPDGGRVHGVVFQGMGEPLANLAAVVQAARVLSDPSALAIDGRAVTVCTAGIPSAIRALARELPAARLGWSIGSALGDTRRSLMPIDRAHPLGEVLDAIGEHATLTRQSPMWAYTLLAGVNDGDDHARALARLARGFAARWSRRPRVSLIAYNAIGPGDPYAASAPERAARFRDVLSEEGVPAIRRYSGGSDVAAACGQLVG